MSSFCQLHIIILIVLFLFRELFESYFMSCVKEADQIKHGGRVVSSMQKKDHNQLWQGLHNGKKQTKEIRSFIVLYLHLLPFFGPLCEKLRFEQFFGETRPIFFFAKLRSSLVKKAQIY